MFKKVKYAMAAALTIATIGLGIGAYLGSTGEAQAADDSVGTSNVYKFADGSMVAGASATLARTENGITAVLDTSELDSNHVYTMWWVIFNNPEYCTDEACGEDDVFNFDPEPGKSDVEVSVQYAAGNVVGRTGMLNLGAHLSVGELPGGDGQVVFGFGLLDSQKAEVHLVVRDHGLRYWPLEEEQLTTYGGACTADTDPPGAGPVGPRECEDLQFAVFVP